MGAKVSDRVSAEDRGPIWVRRESHTTAGTKVILVCVCQKCKESTAPVHCNISATFDSDYWQRGVNETL